MDTKDFAQKELAKKAFALMMDKGDSPICLESEAVKFAKENNISYCAAYDILAEATAAVKIMMAVIGRCKPYINPKN